METEVRASHIAELSAAIGFEVGCCGREKYYFPLPGIESRQSRPKISGSAG
jgi:hypothetical protein